MPPDRTMDAAVRAQLDAAEQLRKAMDALRFSAPVACVYNPLDYAWNAFRAYVERYGSAPKRTLFLGMNPGPWGMAQTGVPLGAPGAGRRRRTRPRPSGRSRLRLNLLYFLLFFSCSR